MALAPPAGAVPGAYPTPSMGPGIGPDSHSTASGVRDMTPGNNIPGIQTGGRDVDGSPDTRGISEKVADAVTGDRIDDKTGKPVV